MPRFPRRARFILIRLSHFHGVARICLIFSVYQLEL